MSSDIYEIWGLCPLEEAWEDSWNFVTYRKGRLAYELARQLRQHWPGHLFAVRPCLHSPGPGDCGGEFFDNPPGLLPPVPSSQSIQPRPLDP